MEETFTCSVEGCEEEVHPKRRALGYSTCLVHGSPMIKPIIGLAYNKGGLQVISPRDVRSMGRKTEADL